MSSRLSRFCPLGGQFAPKSEQHTSCSLKSRSRSGLVCTVFGSSERLLTAFCGLNGWSKPDLVGQTDHLCQNLLIWRASAHSSGQNLLGPRVIYHLFLSEN
jgi:hypothetical protein